MRRATPACAVVAIAFLLPAPAMALRAPKGVRVATVASGLGQPTNVAFDGRGGIWVSSAGHTTTRADGVWYVRRRGARPRHVVSGIFSALGLAWHRGELYVSHVVPYATSAHIGRVTAFGGFDGRRFRRRRVVVDGLPTGLHRVDSLAPGPGGRLYLGVGSQTDAAPPRRRFSAAVVSFGPRGRGLRLEARGLRNPFGLAFIPGTSTLLVSDNGRDDLGLHRPPEELNAVRVHRPVRWYGFPGCWGQGGPACRGAAAPVARLAPHSAVGGVAVARFGKLGPSAFVAEFGSSFAAKPTGGKVVRIPLPGLRAPRRARPRRFLTGLGLQNPLGLGVGPDGALYVTLWRSGRLLRVTAPAPRNPARAALLGLFGGELAGGRMRFPGF
jgi:glucose/arabinose dehydrogenase